MVENEVKLKREGVHMPIGVATLTHKNGQKIKALQIGTVIFPEGTVEVDGIGMVYVGREGIRSEDARCNSGFDCVVDREGVMRVLDAGERTEIYASNQGKMTVSFSNRNAHILLESNGYVIEVPRGGLAKFLRLNNAKPIPGYKCPVS